MSVEVLLPLRAGPLQTKVTGASSGEHRSFADPAGCTAALQQTSSVGDTSRLYMELNWRRGFSSSTVRNLSTAKVDNIARVHYTTPTVDRVATISMDIPYGVGTLYTCRYGPYFVALNLSTSNGYSCTLSADLWGKVGRNLATQAVLVIPSNGVVNVAAGDSFVFTPSAGPVVLASATSSLASSGASGLTYTWTTAGTSPAPVSFSVNCANAAANTTATFAQAGTYHFLVQNRQLHASASPEMGARLQSP